MDTDGAEGRRKTPLGVKLLAVLGALVVVPGGAFLAAANIPTGGRVAIGVAVAWWLVASAVLGKTLLKRRPDIRTPVRAALAVAAVASLAVAFTVTRGSTVDEQIVTAKGAEPGDSAERDAALAGRGGSPAPEINSKEKAKRPEKRDGAAAPGARKKRGSADAKPNRPAAPSPDGDTGDEPARPDGAGTDPAPTSKAPPSPAQNTQLLAGSFSGESGHRGKGDAAVVGLAKGGRMLTFSNFDVDPGAGGLRVYLHAGKTTSDKLGDFVEIARLKGTKGNQQYEIPADLDLRRYSNVVIWCVPFSTRIAQAPLS